MAFFNNIKRAFGFGGDDIADESELYADATVRPIGAHATDDHTLNHTSTKSPTAPSADNVVAEMPDTKELAHKIFDTVVAKFNEALPSFIAKSVDPEAQKKMLFECLDADVKAYVANVHTIAEDQCNRRWNDEKNRLHAAMDDLNAKNRQIEAKSNEMLEKQLSAERQKRALTDRTRDLESTVAKLEAEKEQYELEAKSLINKAKVAGVYEKQIEELTADLNALRAQALKNKAGNSGTDAETISAEIDAMRTAIEEKEASLKEKTSQIDILKAEIESLTTANKNLQEAVDTLSIKDKMATAMVNKMQSDASGQREHANEAEARLKEANSKIEELTLRLEQSEQANEEIEAIGQQLQGFQKIKETLEERIAKLRDLLQKEKSNSENLKAEIEKGVSQSALLQQTIDSLNETIRENLQQHAWREQQLQDRINGLENALSTASQQGGLHRENERKRNRQRTTPKASAPADTSDIDDILGDTDWLVSQPPRNSSMRQDTSEATTDFGYQEPPKRPPMPKNDAQMSLF